MPNVQQVFLPRRMKKGSSVWSVKKVKVFTHLHPRKKQRNVWEVNDHSPGKVLLDYIHILVYKMSEKPDFHPSKVQRVQSNVVKMIAPFFQWCKQKSYKQSYLRGWSQTWFGISFEKNKTKNDFLFFFFKNRLWGKGANRGSTTSRVRVQLTSFPITFFPHFLSFVDCQPSREGPSDKIKNHISSD